MGFNSAFKGLIRNLGLHWRYAFCLSLCDVRVRQTEWCRSAHGGFSEFALKLRPTERARRSARAMTSGPPQTWTAWRAWP